ncbi:transmembrane protein, putative [Medicago truncatula]|uniref:Transmembrane protein, putative n=1 Tax=Medicago truncatula TaxID=3880 RepID=G7KU01_MEDTR|nr:transmembrane protein, putative [Medicago truncatula]
MLKASHEILKPLLLFIMSFGPVLFYALKLGHRIHIPCIYVEVDSKGVVLRITALV